MALATVRISFHNKNVQMISELPTIDAVQDTMEVYTLVRGIVVFPWSLLPLGYMAMPYCHSGRTPPSISAVSLSVVNVLVQLEDLED